LVYEKHRRLQRILWRSNKEEQVQIFELNTLYTYIWNSVPYLAVRLLQKIARLNQSTRPLGLFKILSDFYVDDFVSGVDTIQKLAKMKEKVTTILSEDFTCINGPLIILHLLKNKQLIQIIL